MTDHARSPRVPRLVLTVGLFLLTAAAQPARAQDEPTLAKDSVRGYVQVRNCNFGEARCGRGDRIWFPQVEFRVNGPLASGSQLWVEFTPPGRKPLKYDCPTMETERGSWREVACGGVNMSENTLGAVYKGPVPAGLVPFTIGVRNELLQTNATLFSGKMKTGSYKTTPNATELTYYVDEDWRIPIGYLFFDTDSPSSFHAIIWFRGNPGGVSAHLFYQGKEVGKSQGSAGDNSSWDPAKYEWRAIDCHFESVLAEDPSSLWGPNHPPVYLLKENPGEYEIKVLSGGHLARSVKFTVAEGGSFDNGIAAANKLGSDRVIVPVRVIGDQGPWDKLAWKTGAFYGNPLTGFTPPQ